MSYLDKNRTTDASLTFLSAFLVLNLAGCGGGMVGTGTGPATDTYQLENLPERISPDIPKTLLRGEELAPSQPENLDLNEERSKFLARIDGVNLRKSEGWKRMNDQLAEASLMRLNAEINSTIVDIAFDDIQMRCVDQPIECIIPGNQIKVKLPQNVINRLIAIATDWVESFPPERLNELYRVEAVALIQEQFTLLLDSEVVFGETHYSQLDGAPYDYSVRTFLKRKASSDEEFTVLLWHDEGFNARWDNNGYVAKFLSRSENSSTNEYFYQNKTPSELVIASNVITDEEGRRVIDEHVKVIANDPSSAGVLVEVAHVTAVPLVVDGVSSANLNHGLVQGQMDNGGGYSIFDGLTINIAEIPRGVGYAGLRESFDNVGNLIAGTRCVVRDFNQGIEVCDEDGFEPIGPIGSSIIDSPYYFQPGVFDSLAAVQDVIRWTVEGLPVGISRFAIVMADSAIEPSERELLCWGFQYVSDDTRIFCGATDEQLESTIVLELVDGKPGRIIPTAKLVQIL